MARLQRFLPVALFVALAVVDLFLTPKALAMGAKEANPVMAVAFSAGCGGEVKIAATLVAVAAMTVGWRYIQIRKIAWAAVVLMLLVDLYHLWGIWAIS